MQFLEAHVSERATQEAGPFVGALPPHMRASALLPPAPAVNRRMAARGRQISKLTARVVLKPTDEPTQGGSKDSAGALDGLFAAPPSWQALSSLHVTALVAGLGATDTPAWALTRARCDAASQLSGETAMEVLDESPDVLDICSGAFEGQIAVCVALVDCHLRFLSHCLLTGGNTDSVRDGYAALGRLPPMTRKQHSAGASAVGAAALLALREDAELWRTMLALAEEGEQSVGMGDEEGRAKAASASALCAAVDAVIAAMPQPEED